MRQDSVRRLFAALLLGFVFLKTSVLDDEHQVHSEGVLPNQEPLPVVGAISTPGIVSMPLIPHHSRFANLTFEQHPALRRQRRLRYEAQSSQQNNVLYQGYGTHYVDLWVGTPYPQRQTLIVDTGSAVTAFPCEGCGNNCGSGYHIDSYYRESQSRTFHVVSCNDCMIGSCRKHSYGACVMSVSYQEGSSWEAFEASDVVYSGGPHNHAPTENPTTFRMHFGCQTRLAGLFRTQLADGIMGMEMARSSFWKQMYQQGALRDDSFALCLTQQPTASRSGTGAGTMTLGGVDERLHATPMVYANQLNRRGWFVVRIKRIYLRTRGGERVQVSRDDEPHIQLVKLDVFGRGTDCGNVILDSGTTNTYLSSELFHDFNKAWESLTKQKYDSRRYSHQELLELPTILFQLEASDRDDGDSSTTQQLLDHDNENDVLVAMPPTHYMEYNPRSKKYTSRVYFNERHGGVLGANFLMGHDVFFDIGHDRVGFAESTCDYKSVANYYDKR